jgi:hypothetical protein
VGAVSCYTSFDYNSPSPSPCSPAGSGAQRSHHPVPCFAPRALARCVVPWRTSVRAAIFFLLLPSYELFWNSFRDNPGSFPLFFFAAAAAARQLGPGGSGGSWRAASCPWSCFEPPEHGAQFPLLGLWLGLGVQQVATGSRAVWLIPCVGVAATNGGPAGATTGTGSRRTRSCARLLHPLCLPRRVDGV